MLRSRRSSPFGAERGSVVVGVAMIAAIVVLSVSAIALGASLVLRQRLVGAADSAALAAADAASGAVGGEPCELAGRVARANSVALESCATVGLEVRVRVVLVVAGVRATASARAGPPPDPAVDGGGDTDDH